MAAFATQTTKYTKLFNALLKSDGGFLNMLNDAALVPEGATSGAVTARITTEVTLGSITDGTMATNGAARTEVALTGFEGQHVPSFKRKEVGQYDADADLKETRAFVSAARVAAETEVIADLVAGTPGDTQTLPAGQIDFTTDGTVAEAYLALDKLDQAIAYIEANTAGDPASKAKTFILVCKTAWGKLKTLRNMSGVSNDFERVGRQWFYQDYPIFVSTVTTNFGGASKAAAWVVNGNAEALIWKELDVPHDELKLYGDGMYKKFFQCYGFAGLIQASHYAEVVNSSS